MSATAPALETRPTALIPGEDPQEHFAHHQMYQHLFSPTTPFTEALVNELAGLRWRLQRVPSLEAQLLDLEVHNLTTNPEHKPLIENLATPNHILAFAFTRLVERGIIPNLFRQEARLARRADRLERTLQTISDHQPQSFPEPQPQIAPPPAPPIASLKIEPISTYIRPTPKVGRNEPCPCNSGMKYKQCCLLKQPTAATLPQ